MDRSEFAQVLGYLSAAANKAFTTEQAEVYYDQLGGLPLAVFKVVARRAVREHKTDYPCIPSVSVLVQIARDEMRRHQENEANVQRRLRDKREAIPNEQVRRLLHGIGAMPRLQGPGK